MFFLFLLSLFVYDVAADTLDADCHASATECHVCVCGPHAAQPPTLHGFVLPVTAEHRVPPGDMQFTQRLSDKSLFHPPKTLA